jgi:hypothetical protein
MERMSGKPKPILTDSALDADVGSVRFQCAAHFDEWPSKRRIRRELGRLKEQRK